MITMEPSVGADVHRAEEAYVETLLDLIPGMRARLDAGGVVLDAGCGDGALLVTMARMFPGSTFRGYDISRKAIERALERAAEADLPNVDLAVGDVASIDDSRVYDLVLAFETIRELSFPRVFLRRVVAALKRDGVFLMQEVGASTYLARNTGNPLAPMLYGMSSLHAVPVALVQEGEPLGVMWGKERAMQMLAEAGFRGVHFDTLPLDTLRYYCVATKM